MVTSGSPPRMRGKLFSLKTRPRGGRITPAHAGKTSLNFWGLNLKKDHPRACGENWLYVYYNERGEGSPPRMRGKRRAARAPYQAPRGSPPRMRGKLASHTVRCFPDRITPAHAGKTHSDSYVAGLM